MNAHPGEDMENELERDWMIKETIFSGWRRLPGRYTAEAIWRMRQKRIFLVAIPVGPEDLAHHPDQQAQL